MKILVVATGGTIGSVRADSIDLDKNNLKILDHCQRDGVEYVGVSPFSVLSENISIALWRDLVDYIKGVDFDQYAGVIILHGSDTLAFTAAIIGNAFCDRPIALVAADKPIEDADSNGIANFNLAVDCVVDGIVAPLVCYDGIHSALGITSAGADDRFVSIDTDIQPLGTTDIFDKQILIVPAYPTVDMAHYCLDDVDIVLVNMFHSATVPDQIRDFAQQSTTPFLFVTHKGSADYATSAGMDSILFSSTIENAFARNLLTK